MRVAPAMLLWVVALAHAQAPPAPVCNHQWVPNGLPYFGPVSNPACGQAATQPHTPFQVDASENYNGFVYPYQGQDTKCTTDTVMLMASGECGGTNQGQPVTCMPEDPAFSPSSVSDVVTTTFEYEQFVETGSPGKITCVYSGVNQEKSTFALSASTPNCTCPCPSQASAPAPTFPAPPYTFGDGYYITSPSGWIYVPGTSTYDSSSETVAAVENPAAGSGDAPAAVIEGLGTTSITGANLVFTAGGGSYVANSCSTGAATLTVTCTGSPNFQCAGGGTPTCVEGAWACSNGDTPCTVPPPQGCYANGYQWECTPGGWSCVYVSQSGTPIVIDTKGQGFHLTGISGGVQFPFFPGKPPVQISWTDAKYSNGWLALDRNGNGKIDSGAELFGNLTPQPPSANPNGYAALAVFDNPANGGNGNGMIDPGDQIFNKLLVWIDSNHDGISQPSELHSLRDVGVSVISLHYSLSQYVDRFGNRFRYRAQILDEAGVAHDRCYDVILNDTAVQ